MAAWNLAGQARMNFLDMIDGLSDEQLAQQSLCEQWSAHGVLCHLTSFVETGAVGFLKTMLKSQFDFDKVSVMMANTQIDRPVADVKAALRASANKSAPMPGFPEGMTVSDIVIHTQDVRRPLALPGSLDENLLRTALDFVTTHKMGSVLVSRKPIDAVTLRANDIDWNHGSGPEITGPAEALLMAMSDRPVAMADLTGDGLAAWG